MAKGKKATAADAEIVMRLYEMRREPELRKARHFVVFQLQPKCADDVIKVSQAYGTQENAWLRQCTSYWENAATLLLHGVVNPDLFFAWNGEMVFIYAKFQPFLKEMREKTGFPQIMAGMEKAVNSSAEMKKRVQMLQQRFAQMAAARPAQAAAARA